MDISNNNSTLYHNTLQSSIPWN